jgi:tRNA(adenine34) deaminase
VSDDESESKMTDRLRRRIIQSAPVLAGLTAAGLPLSVEAENRTMETGSNVEVLESEALSAMERQRHEGMMAIAIEAAMGSPIAPFGAVIVDRRTGEIVCTGANDSHGNPTHHGEIVAINNCAREHPGLEWREMALYTTAEPCPMCAGAITWARIGETVYGTSIDTLVSLGVGQILIDSPTVARSAPFYRGRFIAGVLRAETDRLFAEWVASRRK